MTPMTDPAREEVGARGEVLGDRTGAYGAVIGTLTIRSPEVERIVRRALDQALDKATSHEAASVLSARLDELDYIRRQARDKRWTGWESLHAPTPTNGGTDA